MVKYDKPPIDAGSTVISNWGPSVKPAGKPLAGALGVRAEGSTKPE